MSSTECYGAPPHNYYQDWPTTHSYYPSVPSSYSPLNHHPADIWAAHPSNYIMGNGHVSPPATASGLSPPASRSSNSSAELPTGVTASQHNTYKWMHTKRSQRPAG